MDQSSCGPTAAAHHLGKLKTCVTDRSGPNAAAFRVDIGNEGWNFVMAGIVGSIPTPPPLISSMASTAASPSSPSATAWGVRPALTKVLNDNITRQFRIGFLVEQTPDPNNRGHIV